MKTKQKNAKNKPSVSEYVNNLFIYKIHVQHVQNSFFFHSGSLSQVKLSLIQLPFKMRFPSSLWRVPLSCGP